MNNNYLIGLFFLFNLSYVQGQNFRSFDIRNGFPHQYSYSIQQDAIGYVWFGLQNGICRYDGYELKDFKESFPDVSSKWTNDLLAYQNDMLIATKGGLIRYFFEQDTFIVLSSEHYKLLEKGLNEEEVIAIDEKGKVWIWNIEQGIKKAVKKDLPPVLSIINYKNGLWFGTTQGLYIQNDSHIDPLITLPIGNAAIQCFSISENGLLLGSNKGIVEYRDTEYAWKTIWLDSGSVSNIVEDKNRDFWVIRNRDLYKSSSTIRGSTTFVPIGVKYCTDLFIDKIGNVWVATEKDGVKMHHIVSTKVHHFDKTTTGLQDWSSHKVWTITQSSDGFWWLGTTREGGLSKYHLQNNVFESLDLDKFTEADNSNNVVSLLLDTLEDRIWVGTLAYGVLELNLAGELLNHHIVKGTSNDMNANKAWVLYKDNDRDIWLGTYNGLRKYNSQESSFGEAIFFGDSTQEEANKIWTLLHDEDSILWVGTYSGGLFRYNKKKNTIKEYPRTVNDELLGNVSVLIKDKMGVLWIATYGNGLFFMENGNVYKFEEDFDLQSIAAIQQTDSLFWISSAEGMGVFDPINRKTLAVLRDENFEVDYNQHAAYKDVGGNLFWGMTEGFQYFHPDSINYKFPASLKITSIDIDGKLYSVIDQDSIFYCEKVPKTLTIDFCKFQFYNTNYVEYKYRITELADYWAYPDPKTHKARFSQLSAGEYTFEVIAKGESGVWSDYASIKLYIPIPWYTTIWAWIGYLAISILLIYYFIYIPNQKKIALFTANDQKLRAQINSHFLANTLTTLQAKVLDETPMEASIFIAQFGSYVREVFESSRKANTSLATELEMVAQYISIVQESYQDDFIYEAPQLASSLNAEQLMVPSFILQPLIENSLEYGIWKLNRIGRIQIKIDELRTENLIRIIVLDNGKGLNTTKSRQTKESHATAIIKERLRHFNKKLGKHFHAKAFTRANRIENSEVIGVEVTILLRKRLMKSV